MPIELDGERSQPHHERDAPTSTRGATGEPRRRTIVMVATSYPRFPGDAVGTFMEPIAHGIAARGHDVHMVLPWHPRLARHADEGRVHFHAFRYAPLRQLAVFGYAEALKEDVRLRASAPIAAPLAMAAGWRCARRVARRVGADVMHGHWVAPGGVIAALAAGRTPLVISLHGSDVYVAERHALVGRAARMAFARAHWVTACSEDLRQRALSLGAPAERSETLPYGVDAARFAPSPEARRVTRATLGASDGDQIVFAAGRFVRKKGFEYLIDGFAAIARDWPRLTLVLGGGGDLDAELRARASARGVGDRVRFAGMLPHDAVAAHLAAADIAAAPSVRDDQGNVDGLPNFVMEALASATPLITTAAGGIGAVAIDDENAIVVAERDPGAIGRALAALLREPVRRTRLGGAARARVLERHTWARVAERFEAIYDLASAGLPPFDGAK